MGEQPRSLAWLGSFGVIVLLLINSAPLLAQPCPGDMVTVGATIAERFDIAPFRSSVPLCFNMPGSSMTYTGGPYGIPFGPTPPTACTIFIAPGATAFFRAIWPSPTANTTINGCDFLCPNIANGITCKVRGGTALPVELMDFDVEDEEPAE